MSNTNEGQEATPEQPLESTQPTTQDINHTITQEDVDANPGEGLVVGEEITIPAESIVEGPTEPFVLGDGPVEPLPTAEFLDLTQKSVPVADIELSTKFVEALHTFKDSLPEGYTLNVMADGYPNLEVITFDKSIPNSQRHIESLRAILIRNDNAYGVHRRYTGTEDQLIEQLKVNQDERSNSTKEERTTGL